MGRGGWGPNTPRVIREQPQEGLPGRETNEKIKRLHVLRLKIREARRVYRMAPTPSSEGNLRRLIRQEEILSDEVGFGANAPPQFGRSKQERS
jgi:hypothetical protein